MMDTFPGASSSKDSIAEDSHTSTETTQSRLAPWRPFLEKFAAGILILFAFVLPIAILPSPGGHFQATKTLVVALSGVLAFVVWAILRLRAGRIVFPNTLLLPIAGALVLVYALSALISGGGGVSFFGQGFESDTVVFVAFLMLLFALGALVLGTSARATALFAVLFAASGVVALYQLLRLVFGTGLLSFGLFGSTISNLVGKWNDFGIFFGLIALLSLVAFEVLRPQRGLRRAVAYATLIASLFFLALVNFTTLWIVVGLFALALSVGIFSTRRSRAEISDGILQEQAPRASLPAFALAAIAVVFLGSSLVFPSDPLRAVVSRTFSIAHIEARPSWQATFDVARDALAGGTALFGVGPNRFSEVWGQFKPDGINETPFWNIDFNFGIGFIPTALITTGLVGLAAWLLFIGLFLFIGAKYTVRPRATEKTQFLLTGSFLGAFFLWVMAVLYIPSPVLLALATLLSGVFVGLLVAGGALEERALVFNTNPRVSFAVSLVLVVLLVVALAGGYATTRRYVATTLFQKAVRAQVTGESLDTLIEHTSRSIDAFDNAAAQRGLTQLHLVRVNNLLVAASSDGRGADDIREEFSGLFGSALGAAQRAIELRPHDYQSWTNLGGVYAAIVPLGIDGAHENARAAYDRALELNPKNPAIDLTLARMEASRGENEAARGFIAQALEKKANYTEAIFLLSQIEVAEGNLSAAIDSVEEAAFLAPNDPLVFFQLGLLHYSDDNFQEAINQFERAVGLNNVYANARYFLGLSYDRVDRDEDAIVQFEVIEELNPDNQEVESILENLRAGREPFADAEPPLDEPPEERDELPIEEGLDEDDVEVE